MLHNKLLVCAAALAFSFSLNSASINSKKSLFENKITHLQQEISKNVKSEWAIGYLNQVLSEDALKPDLEDVIVPAIFDCVMMVVIFERPDLMKHFYEIFLKMGGKPSEEDFIELLSWAVKTDCHSMVPALIDMARDNKISLDAENLTKIIMSVERGQF